MQKIVVMNTKGGCGKTTIATNLAGFYAYHGYKTALFDYDSQGSSAQWTKRRPQGYPEIHGVAAYQRNKSVTRSWQLRLPSDTERVIIDTPAGVQGSDLVKYLNGVNTIIVPVLPSVIDTQATADFLRGLLVEAKVRTSQTRVVIIANRVKPRTMAFQSLEKFLVRLNISVVGCLRDTVNYSHAADLGLGVCELPISKVDRERELWLELVSKIDDEVSRDVARLKRAAQSKQSLPDQPHDDSRVIPFDPSRKIGTLKS